MWIKGRAASLIRVPRLWRLIELYLVRLVPTRHVGKDDCVAFLQTFEHLYGIHRSAAEFYGHPSSCPAIRRDFEKIDCAVFLRECWGANIKNVVEPLEVDRAVNAQVRAGTLRQHASQFDVYRDCSILYCGIDSHHGSTNRSVVGIDGRGFTDLNIPGLSLRNF